MAFQGSFKWACLQENIGVTVDVAKDLAVLPWMKPGPWRLDPQRQLPGWVEESSGVQDKDSADIRWGRGGRGRWGCTAQAEDEGEHVPI